MTQSHVVNTSKWKQYRYTRLCRTWRRRFDVTLWHTATSTVKSHKWKMIKKSHRLMMKNVTSGKLHCRCYNREGNAGSDRPAGTLIPWYRGGTNSRRWCWSSLFLHLVFEMDLGVTFLLVGAGKLSAADVAGKGLFTGVGPHVGRQVVRSRERPQADAALEGLLSRVDSDVAG